MQWIKECVTTICEYDNENASRCYNDRYFMSVKSHYLHIRNLTTSDSGAYVCQMTGDQNVTRTAHLWVSRNICSRYCENSDKILILILFAIMSLALLVAILIQSRKYEKYEILKSKIL